MLVFPDLEGYWHASFLLWSGCRRSLLVQEWGIPAPEVSHMLLPRWLDLAVVLLFWGRREDALDETRAARHLNLDETEAQICFMLLISR